MSYVLCPARGFTLIELLIVTGLSVAVLVVGALGLVNYRSAQDLRLAKQAAIALLRDAQANATTGEDGRSWGVRVVGGPRGTAALFSTNGADYIGSATTTLKSTLEFLDPSAGMVKDVVFDSLTGYPSSGGTVIIKLGIVSDVTASATVTIYPNGRFEY